MGDWLNVGCGPWRAPAPWINLDVVETATIHPDRIVTDSLRPAADWADGSVDRIYLGHVLEHVPVDELPAFFVDLTRALTLGGEVCVVGPDVLRAITRWHDGLEPWDLVMATLEGPDYHPADQGFQLADRPDLAWREARHWWNCTEARVVRVLGDAGFWQVTTHPLDSPHLDRWPVTDRAAWQCAVTATRP